MLAVAQRHSAYAGTLAAACGQYARVGGRYGRYYNAKDALPLHPHDRGHAGAKDSLASAQIPVACVRTPHMVVQGARVLADTAEDHPVGEHVTQVVDGLVKCIDEALVLRVREAFALRRGAAAQAV